MQLLYFLNRLGSLGMNSGDFQFHIFKFRSYYNFYNYPKNIKAIMYIQVENYENPVNHCFLWGPMGSRVDRRRNHFSLQGTIMGP